jgi:hypothetical protein
MSGTTSGTTMGGTTTSGTTTGGTTTSGTTTGGTTTGGTATGTTTGTTSGTTTGSTNTPGPLSCDLGYFDPLNPGDTCAAYCQGECNSGAGSTTPLSCDSGYFDPANPGNTCTSYCDAQCALARSTAPTATTTAATTTATTAAPTATAPTATPAPSYTLTYKPSTSKVTRTHNTDINKTVRSDATKTTDGIVYNKVQIAWTTSSPRGYIIYVRDGSGNNLNDAYSAAQYYNTGSSIIQINSLTLYKINTPVKSSPDMNSIEFFIPYSSISQYNNFNSDGVPFTIQAYDSNGTSLTSAVSIKVLWS